MYRLPHERQLSEGICSKSLIEFFCVGFGGFLLVLYYSNYIRRKRNTGNSVTPTQQEKKNQTKVKIIDQNKYVFNYFF